MDVPCFSSYSPLYTHNYTVFSNTPIRQIFQSSQLETYHLYLVWYKSWYELEILTEIEGTINLQKIKKLYIQEWKCDHGILPGSAKNNISHNENTEYVLTPKIIRRELCEVFEL